MNTSRLLKALLAVGTVSATAISCGDVPVRVAPGPAGVLRGTILYAGPLPCTEKGHIVGNAIVLMFNKNLLPPPDGLAAKSYRVGVVPGDVLFQGYTSRLYANPDGSRWCPDQQNPANMVTAGAPFEIGVIEPGTYQVRGFFNVTGEFDAVFKFSNLPTLGDVTGGAITNATAVLAGASPKWQEFTFGTPNAQGVLEIAPQGQVISGVSVAFAKPTPYQRPYFNVTKVTGPQPDPKTPPVAVDVATIGTPSVPRITINADFHLANATAGDPTIKDRLPVFRIEPGLPTAETDAAKKAPFFMHVDNPGKIASYWYDANHDGVIDKGDHVIGSPTAMVMAPIVSLAKLGPTDLDGDEGLNYNAAWNPSEDPRVDRFDPIRRSSQINPRVIASAVVLYKDDLIGLLSFDKKQQTPDYFDHISAMLRPTAICAPGKKNPDGTRDTGNPREAETTVVTPFEYDLLSPAKPVIPELELTKADVAAQLNRNKDIVDVVYACLIPGFYSINLIYPETGQAWTLPNESGVCMPGEVEGKTADGKPVCSSRAKFVSQSLIVQVLPEKVAGTCAAIYQALPADKQTRYRETCLRPDEQAKLDKGVLWTAK